MKKDTVVQLRQPDGKDLLTAMLREGARQLIVEALQAEFEEFLSQFAGQRDEHERAAVVRNGFQPRRELLTGLGPVSVQMPKARSRIAEPVVFRAALGARAARGGPGAAAGAAADPAVPAPRQRGEPIERARDRRQPPRLLGGDARDGAEAAPRVVDPHVLTIDCARRVAPYKRLEV